MQSESIKELATALVKAQSEMGGAKKNSTNPHFKSTFANLESVWEAAHEPLAKNGLAVIQTVGFDEKAGVTLATILIHTSGEWISGIRPLCAKATDPQGIGSAITYARRYDLMAMLGICPEDDDGEQAMARNQPQARQTPPQTNRAPAPAAKAPPKPSMRPTPVYRPGSISEMYEWIIPFGKKYKGVRLGDVPLDEAINYAEWLESQAQQKKEDLQGPALEFYERVMAIRHEEEERTHQTGFAPIREDEVPF